MHWAPPAQVRILPLSFCFMFVSLGAHHGALFRDKWGRCRASSLKGLWCSGITSASHAEGPGFKPRRIHSFYFCFWLCERTNSSLCMRRNTAARVTRVTRVTRQQGGRKIDSRAAQADRPINCRWAQRLTHSLTATQQNVRTRI